MIYKQHEAYITILSAERDGRMRLTATGVPRQQAFKISPNEPYRHHPLLVKALVHTDQKNTAYYYLLKALNATQKEAINTST